MTRDNSWLQSDDTGLRPMVPRKDLRRVVQLVSEGFDEWQSWRGRSFLSLLEVLSYTGPFLSLARFSSAFRQFCSAIVWVEGGQVVGVVAGHPIGPDPRYWIFRNIVVSKPHRGKGIGRELQRGLIERASSEGAQKAIVMVRVNNPASINLASSDGFRLLTITSDMKLIPSQAMTPAPPTGDSLRQQKPSDWHQVYQLTQAATPPALRSFNPVREDDFRTRMLQRLGHWLGNLISGQWEHQFVAEESGELAALLTVKACLWGEHRLEMTVHPSWRGHLEEILVRKGLGVLSRYPKRPVNIKVPVAHTEAITVLSQRGFNEMKTQAILGLDLRQFRNQTSEDSTG
jgi:RimJ/RimL family protein N-acetyltransferase